MLEGIVRESIGKKATKALRREGYLIANIYGKDFDNLNVAFKESDFLRAVRNKDSLRFDVTINGETFPVVIQEYQKHPVKNKILHVDLRVAKDGTVAKWLVPVKTEGTPKGLKNKGMFIFLKTRVKVKSTIENLPKSFHFKIDDLDTGDNFLVRDIKLPDGVECFLDPRVPVVGVIKAK